MFHRVKSETTTESSDQKPQEQAAQEEVQVEEAAAEELVIEEDTETTDAEETSEDTTQDQDTQEKETETMTNEDTTTKPVAPEAPSYTQSSQSAVRPGGYPGAYPGVAYGAQAVTAQEDATDRTLTIGAGITMSGEIESCDNLIVEGTVEAALKGARNLDIAESGTFYGTVDIEDAVIAGRFEGELTVNGRLVVRSGGIITGAIAYGTLEVEAGAIIDGRLTPVAAMQAQQQAPAEKKAAPAPKAKVAKAEEKPADAANSEGALFASQA